MDTYKNSEKKRHAQDHPKPSKKILQIGLCSRHHILSVVNDRCQNPDNRKNRKGKKIIFKGSEAGQNIKQKAGGSYQPAPKQERITVLLKVFPGAQNRVRYDFQAFFGTQSE